MMSEKPPRTRPTDSMPAIVDDADSFDREMGRKLLVLELRLQHESGGASEPQLQLMHTSLARPLDEAVQYAVCSKRISLTLRRGTRTNGQPLIHPDVAAVAPHVPDPSC